ncbi:hypothetical protein F3Y22_tig00000764pilonHSYRG00041 [Hibiscus syriacus]|uniref:Uncharacterized protein n=1 Tax=Hibiscus syriacus TaxID=106335 RepID=A0A6A3D3M2_HIBSY|nr:hypothetical protein F3Y22_tig00000764pilonHSYRG00041 [Hibiscus syriacus]
MIVDGYSPLPLKRRRFTNIDSMDAASAKAKLAAVKENHGREIRVFETAGPLIDPAQAQHRERRAIEVLKKLVGRIILYHSYSIHWLQQSNWLPTLEATLALDEESVRRVGDDSVGGPIVSRQLRLIRILMRDLVVD